MQYNIDKAVSTAVRLHLSAKAQSFSLIVCFSVTSTQKESERKALPIFLNKDHRLKLIAGAEINRNILEIVATVL